ncbi:uncharacterized protein I206_100133 [Kwoniella pini CBS 10737]|uniref:Uncharacterized protein n=1 Tax=Kwoniella pini CBS 10737 TaxID=1296096 RepID=A0A1B9IEF9_9TREE|nr:uncharacterized protein I206_01194 [Kwoniella pini CBS 10737]OCF53887.1 hypothetical protein I206_01194 [Kwoniella pini CBS 10737]
MPDQDISSNPMDIDRSILEETLMGQMPEHTANPAVFQQQRQQEQRQDNDHTAPLLALDLVPAPAYALPPSTSVGDNSNKDVSGSLASCLPQLSSSHLVSANQPTIPPLIPQASLPTLMPHAIHPATTLPTRRRDCGPASDHRTFYPLCNDCVSIPIAELPAYGFELSLPTEQTKEPYWCTRPDHMFNKVPHVIKSAAYRCLETGLCFTKQKCNGHKGKHTCKPYHQGYPIPAQVYKKMIMDLRAEVDQLNGR